MRLETRSARVQRALLPRKISTGLHAHSSDCNNESADNFAVLDEKDDNGVSVGLDSTEAPVNDIHRSALASA